MTRRFTTSLVVCGPLLVAPLPQVALAQYPPSRFEFAADTVTMQEHAYRPTYWLEGATIGGALVGSTSAWLAYELGCEFSDIDATCSAGHVLAAGAVGALTGGIVGGLIGGAFSAPQERPLGGRPGQAMAIGGGAGALWSFGLFW